MAANLLKADELDREFLQCALCIDRLQKPKLLPCQHTFCQSCLELWVSQNNGKLLCPFCRREFQVPVKGVDGLPDNFFVNSIIDFINRKRKASCATISCDACESEAAHYCYDCIQFLCLDCAGAHQRLRPMRFHRMVTIDEYQVEVATAENVFADEQVKVCGSHEGQEIEIYCDTCGIPICQKCRANDHASSSHKLIKLSEAAHGRRKILSDLAEKAREKDDRLREIVTMLRETQQLLKWNHDQILSQIRTKKADLIEHVTLLCDEVEGELQHEYQTRKEILEKDIDYFQQNLEKSSSVCNVTQNLLSEGDEESLLFVSRDTVKKLESNIAAQIRPKTDEDGIISFIPPEKKLEVSRSKIVGQIEKKRKSKEENTIRLRRTSFPALTVGDKACVKLQSIDREGKPLRGKGTMVTAKICQPNGEVGIAKVTNTESGTYDVTFRPRLPGKHRLILSSIGRQVSMEPYDLDIKPVQRKIVTFGNPSLPDCIPDSVGLREPCGVAISQNNSEILIADTGNNAIRIFDMAGNYKTQISFINMDHDFEPMSLALANTGQIILVTDAGNKQVLICTRDCQLRRRFSHPALQRPCGIALTRSGYIVVADLECHCLFVFDSSGMLLKQIGKFGTERGQFRRPFDIAIDSADQLVVTDRDNHRIQILDLNGNVQSVVGEDRRSLGDDGRLLKYPTGVALDQEDNLYVCSDWDSQILMFDSKGGFIRKLFSADVQGLRYPNGIAVGPNKELVIVDYGQDCAKIVEL